MASPNALNLAGKLFALDPELTPADVIELMTRGRNSPCRRRGRTAHSPAK